MLFTLLRPLVTLWLWLFYPYRIHGKKNIIQDGNVIVICNHLCKVDVPYIGFMFKGKTYYLAKKEWFDKKCRGWLFRQMGGIPIDREHADIQGVKEALSVLKKGKRLCIFPEGTRNKTGGTEIQQLHGGGALLAFKTGAKIIPVNIHEKAKIFRKNDVYIGEPFDFKEFKGARLDSELNEKLTDIMYEKLCDAREKNNEIVNKRKEKKHAEVSDKK